MERNASPVIVAVERLSEGVVVKFADGHCVYYSAHLLYTSLARAEPQNEEHVAW